AADVAVFPQLRAVGLTGRGQAGTLHPDGDRAEDLHVLLLVLDFLALLVGRKRGGRGEEVRDQQGEQPRLHTTLLAQEELSARSGSVAAVDVGVAVEAGARDQPRVRRPRRPALVAAVISSGVAGEVMAVLAHVRRALGEELCVDRAVRRVA